MANVKAVDVEAALKKLDELSAACIAVATGLELIAKYGKETKDWSDIFKELLRAAKNGEKISS